MTQASELVSMNQQDRIELIVDVATAVWKGDSIRAKVCTAQALLESRLLNNPISKLALYNNLFGIKGKGISGDSVMMPTVEVINGKTVKILAEFAKNDTLENSFEQHHSLLHKPRYFAVIAAMDYIEATRALVKCGYATDPKYAKKLQSIIGTYLE